MHQGRSHVPGEITCTRGDHMHQGRSHAPGKIIIDQLGDNRITAMHCNNACSQNCAVPALDHNCHHRSSHPSMHYLSSQSLELSGVGRCTPMLGFHEKLYKM